MDSNIRTQPTMKPGAALQSGKSAKSGLRRLLACVGALVFVAGAVPAAADSYDSAKAGYPIRVVAYMLHPVGVVLDTLIFRPAHWLISRRPLDQLFGHQD